MGYPPLLYLILLFSVGLGAAGLSPFVISDIISVGLGAAGLSPFVISDVIFCRTGSSWVIPLCYI